MSWVKKDPIKRKDLHVGCLNCSTAALIAPMDPDHDWRIVKFGPMHGETFQRQVENNWVCIESNEGFA